MEKSNSGLLRLIAVFKLFKALTLIAVGVGALKLIHANGEDALDRWIAMLGFNPGGKYVDLAIGKIISIPPGKLKELGVGSFFYAALFLTEGFGLWLLKPWAEWFTVVITASLVPLEIYEIVHHPTAGKVGVLAINLAVLGYLLLRIRKERSQNS